MGQIETSTSVQAAEKVQTSRDQWMRSIFERGDRNSDNQLSLVLQEGERGKEKKKEKKKRRKEKMEEQTGPWSDRVASRFCWLNYTFFFSPSFFFFFCQAETTMLLKSMNFFMDPKLLRRKFYEADMNKKGEKGFHM